MSSFVPSTIYLCPACLLGCEIGHEHWHIRHRRLLRPHFLSCFQPPVRIMPTHLLDQVVPGHRRRIRCVRMVRYPVKHRLRLTGGKGCSGRACGDARITGCTYASSNGSSSPIIWPSESSSSLALLLMESVPASLGEAPGFCCLFTPSCRRFFLISSSWPTLISITVATSRGKQLLVASYRARVVRRKA